MCGRFNATFAYQDNSNSPNMQTNCGWQLASWHKVVGKGERAQAKRRLLSNLMWTSLTIILGLTADGEEEEEALPLLITCEGQNNRIVVEMQETWRT
jgi:hypothetical protein